MWLWCRKFRVCWLIRGVYWDWSEKEKNIYSGLVNVKFDLAERYVDC